MKTSTVLINGRALIFLLFVFLVGCRQAGIYNAPDAILDASILESSKIIRIEIANKEIPNSGIFRLVKNMQDGSSYDHYFCYEGIEYIGKSEIAPFWHEYYLHNIIFEPELPEKLRNKGVLLYLVIDLRLFKQKCPPSKH